MADRVEVSITIAADPELVFRYFTDPSRVTAWLGEGSVIESAPGGEVSIRYPNGDVARGTVSRIVEPQLIEFTWGYEAGRYGLEPGASKVVVRLTAVAEGTRVSLEHSGLAAADQRSGQKAGWRYQLGRLGATVSDENLGAKLPGTLDAYFRAWNETDQSRRAQLLASCLEEDAAFRDAMNTTASRADLDETIAVAQSFAPGIRLESDGSVQHCKGAVLFGWRVLTPDGQSVARGINYGELTSRGKFRHVVGFWQD